MDNANQESTHGSFLGDPGEAGLRMGLALDSRALQVTDEDTCKIIEQQ